MVLSLLDLPNQLLRLIRQIQETQYQSFRGSPGVADKELNRTEGGEQLFVRGVTNPHLHPLGSAEPAVLDAEPRRPRCRASSAMRPFCRRSGAFSQKSLRSPIMETTESPDARYSSDLEASKFIEYLRQAYVPMAYHKVAFRHHWAVSFLCWVGPPSPGRWPSSRGEEARQQGKGSSV